MIYFRSVRNDRFVVGSRMLSSMFNIFANDEPSLNDMVVSSENGIYIGKSGRLSTPIFLDPSKAINPHMFVVGITGSGKSYLMRSIILRMALVKGLGILVLDFTGEYRELANFAFCKRADPENASSLIDSLADGIVYIDLSIKNESTKIKIATSILGSVVSRMRNFKADGRSRIFVFLDEAWKILKSNDILETLIREGRKYGVGAVLASQILSDVEKDFLQNIGTIFVFRLQSSVSLNELVSDYGIYATQARDIQNFGQGRCMLIQLSKAEKRSYFMISRVEGVRLDKMIKVGLDEEGLDIEEGEFYRAIGGLGIRSSNLADLRLDVDRSGSIGLSKLVGKLLVMGADRRETLHMLRSLGFRDSDIADAFSMTVG